MFREGTPSYQRLLPALAAAWICAAGAWAAPGDVVINEILQNPAAVSDANGEWFEVVNTTGAAIDINGWTISDDDFDSHVITNGGPLLVPAGGFLVLGNNADSGTNGGVTVAYEFSGIALANGGDELVLTDTFATEIDRVEWDDGATFPDPNGASMSLIDPALDNNVGANWCTASTPFGAGDFGTPGAANDCPVDVDEIVINEILQNPAAVSDADGEWFELYNPGASAVDINGWTIADNDFDSHVITNGGPLLVPAGGFLVLGNNADSGTNGGVTVAYEFSGIALANGGDELVLTDTFATEIDRVEWDDGATFPDPNGASMSLIDPALDNNVGANWCTASTPFGAGDFGTPGAANDCPVDVDEIVINEILQNPAAVSDADGEWFELYNPGASAVDINGWTIADNDFDSHVIANGGPLLVPAGGYLVLGSNADSGANGGVTVAYEYGGVFLANGSDELVLTDTFATEIDRVEWDNGATFPDPNGASMSLAEPSLDNNVGANWCEASTPFGDGDLGTPGAANDCPVAELVINEIDYDQPGADNAEFIEIANVGGAPADLGQYQLELVNGASGGAAVYETIALPATLLNPGDYYVVCGNALNVVGCDLVTSPSSNLIQNGPPDAVALTRGGAIVDTVSYEGSVPGYTEGSGSGLEDSSSAGDEFKSIARIPNGVDTDQNNVDFAFVCITPGAANVDRSSGCTATGPALEIFEIQGSGAASPFEGDLVTTVDNVVTAVGPDSFFMQTPTARADGNVDTSDGIYVFTGGPPGVAVGDQVDVVGVVSEFFGFTEFAFPAVTLDGTATVPAPVSFNAAVPSPIPSVPSCAIEFECYEGMLVEIIGGAVTGPNQRFNPDPIAEVHITAAPERTFREPGVEFPGLGMPPIPTWDGNPEVFELDPDKLGLPNQIIPAGSTFDAVGAIGFEFGGYELWPRSLTVTPAPLPVPVRPREPFESTVGSLNLFRLFDDVDDPPSTNVVGDTRDDFVVSTAEYVRRLSKLATYIVDVMDSPGILAVQEAEKVGVLEDLAFAVNALDPSVNYTSYLIEGNDVGTIDVGFMVRDNVQVNALTQLGASELFTFDDPPSALHDRPPLLLEAVCDGTFPISLMVLHMRSLGGIETTRTQQKRYEQAESVAEKVQDIQTADPNVNLVVIGDFNAFEFTDGYVDLSGIVKGDFDPAESLVCMTNACADLVDPDLTDQVLGIDSAERYSFIFRGTAQVLDHAMTSEPLGSLVTGLEFGRGNADAAVDLINDDGTVEPANLPLRSSDHDGLVLYVFKDEDKDGVPDAEDVCLGTVIPEGVPTSSLGTNRWALTDGDTVFDTTPPNGNGPGLSFTIEDTGGCSCEQIIEAQGLGKGHTKFGCSNGAMLNWVDLVSGS